MTELSLSLAHKVFWRQLYGVYFRLPSSAASVESALFSICARCSQACPRTGKRQQWVEKGSVLPQLCAFPWGGQGIERGQAASRARQGLLFFSADLLGDLPSPVAPAPPCSQGSCPYLVTKTGSMPVLQLDFLTMPFPVSSRPVLCSLRNSSHGCPGKKPLHRKLWGDSCKLSELSLSRNSPSCFVSSEYVTGREVEYVSNMVLKKITTAFRSCDIFEKPELWHPSEQQVLESLELPLSLTFMAEEHSSGRVASSDLGLNLY